MCITPQTTSVTTFGTCNITSSLFWGQDEYDCNDFDHTCSNNFSSENICNDFYLEAFNGDNLAGDFIGNDLGGNDLSCISPPRSYT